MSDQIPHHAFVVVADGTGARFFRNDGRGRTVLLIDAGHLSPSNLEDDGPAGHRPSESSKQQTDEATFAKQLANELYRRAHEGDFEALVLIADPKTLGQIRPGLHKEVKNRMILELAKTLTKSPVKDIEKTLS